MKKKTFAKSILQNISNKINGMIGVAKNLMISSLFFLLTLSTGFANPEGGVVAAGNATITNPSANTMQINQTSDKAVINWQSYNIGNAERVHYQQPSQSSISLNRVNPNNGPAKIYGTLTSNGQVWIVNPAGVWFGPNSYVNVGGILASTADINDTDFMAGNFHFQQSPLWNGAIINEGYIKTAEAGLVALVGSGVVNNGMIEANLGTVVLASGSEFTVYFSGNSMIGFTVDTSVFSAAHDQNGESLKDGVKNAGQIIANGGKVLMSAKSSSQILDNAINMSGIVETKSVGMKNGEIILQGDGDNIVTVSGKLIASGKNNQEKGGTIKVLGNKVAVIDHAEINVSGNTGGGEVLIGGNAHGLGVEQNADYVYLAKDATINASALLNGNGGKVVLWSNIGTHFYGSISALGGELSGNGGWVETSGHEFLNANGYVNTAATNGHAGIWLLDPANVTISTGADANYTNLANIFTPDSGAATSTVNTTTLATALLTNNITITTSNAGVDGGSVGNITISNPVTWASTNSLTLIAANNILINAAVTIGNGAAAQFILNAAGATTQTGIISGSGSLVLQGAGTTTLSLATNSYSGGTFLNAGTLSVASLPSAAGNSTIGTGTLSINGGTLSYTGGNVTFNRAVTVGASGGTIQSTTAGTTTLTLSGGISNSGVLTFNTLGAGTANISLATNAISGAGSIVKNGTSNLTFGVANTYTGTTTVNNGTLTVGNINALGSGVNQSSSITVASGATLAMNASGTFGNTNSLTLNGTGITAAGALISTTGTSTMTNPITLAGNTTFGGASGLTLNGVINDGGNGFGITKLGAGTLTLGGSNTFTGATNVNVGTMTLSNANALGSGATQSSDITVTATNAALNLNFATATLGNTNTITLNGTGVGAAGALTASTSTETLLNAIVLGSNTTIGGANNMNLNGIISDGGSGFSLTKTGNGIITLSGNNTFSGGVTINTGTLSILNSGALGTAGAIAINNAAILRMNLSGNTLGNSGNITMSGTAALTSTAGAGITDTLNNLITLNGTHTFTSTTATAQLTLNGNITNSATALTITGSGNTLISSSIGGGAGGITKSGTGTLTLSNANTYTGNTTISAGTLRATNANALGTVGTISIATASTLSLNLSGAALANANTITMTGTASIVNNVATTLTDILNNAITLTAAGTPTITSTTAGATLQLNGNITNNTAALTINGAGDTILVGVLGPSSGSLTKAGAGTLSLNSVNTYTGATTISAGSIKLNINNAIGASAVNLSVSGANLNLNGFNDTIGSLAGVAGTTVTLGSGTLTTGGNNTSTTLTGVMSGSGNLVKTGTGTMTLAGANTFLGTTTINTGTLSVSNANGLGSGATQSSSITVTPGATLNFAFNATFGNTNLITASGTGASSVGAITSSTSTNTITNNILLSGNITFGGATNYIINGVINDGGNGYSLTKIGAGTLSLGGSNTYTGATLINVGTLNLTNANALGSGGSKSSSITVAATGAALGLNFPTNTLANNNNITLNGTGIASAGALVASTSTDTLSNLIILGSNTTIGGAANMILNGAISDGGSGFRLTKVGAGTTTLNAANTYSGGTTINTGTLNILNTNALGTLGNIAVNNAAVLSFNLSGNTLANTNTITLSNTAGLTNTVGAGLTDTLSNLIVLNGTHSITSTTATAQLSLTNNITNSATTLTFTGSGNTLVTGIIGGNAGGIAKSGTGTLTLSNANTYTGATSVTAGTLRITDANALGGATGGTISVGTNSTLSMNLNGNTLANTNTITLTGSANLIDTAASAVTDTLNNPITLTAAGTQTITSTNAGALFKLTGNITNNTAALAINAVGDMTISGIIGGGSGSVTKSGAGTLTLQGLNTYTGLTRVNAGILSVAVLDNGGVASNIGASSNAAANLVLGGGTLQYTGATDTINRNFTLATGTTNSIDVTQGSTNLTLTGASTATTGALRKLGNGILTLSGANLYTGLTTILAGTLAEGTSNALATGAVTVNGGTFNIAGFSDSVGAVTLTDGSILGTTGVLTGSSFTVQNGLITAILGGTGNLSKTTSGTVTLSGLNTYTGSTTLSAGTLSVSVLANGGVASNIGAATTASGNLVFSGGTLEYTGASTSTNHNFVLTTATTTNFNITNGAANVIFTGASTNTSGALTKMGDGQLTLAGTNLYTGQTTVNDGVLAEGITNALSSGVVTIDGGTFDIATFTDTVGTVTLINGDIIGSTGIFRSTSFLLQNGNVSGNIGGTGGVAKSTAGTVLLSGNNSYTGATNVNAGILEIAANTSLGTTSSTTVATNAELNFSFSNATLTNTNTITLNGTGLGNGALNLSGDNITFNNPLTINSAVTIGGAGNGTMVSGGTISGANSLTISLPSAGMTLKTVTLTGGSNLDMNVNGNISQTGIFTISGTTDLTANNGAISLSQNNQFSGVVSLTNSGLNDVNINNAIDLTLGIANIGNKLTATTSGTLALAGNLTADATGDSIVLSSARFDNTGAYTLSPGVDGRFLIWSSNPSPFSGPTPDVLGGITYDFKQYNATYNVTPVAGTGNGVLYTLSPQITISLIANPTPSKVYDGLFTGAPLLTSNYAASAGVDGDDISVTGAPTSGVYASKNVGTNIQVTVSGLTNSNIDATNGSAIVYGYTLTSANATGLIGEITPATLTYSADLASRVYGAANPAFTGSVSGFVNGETQASSTTGVLSFTSPALNTSNVGSYAINGSGLTANNGNYVFVQAPSNATALTITPATLTTSNVIANNKNYDGNTTATLNLASATLNGVLFGDNVNIDPVGYNANFATPDVGTNIPVSVMNLGLIGTAAANYTLVQPVGLAADIIAVSPPVPPTPVIINDLAFVNVIFPTEFTGKNPSLFGLGKTSLVEMYNGMPDTFAELGAYTRISDDCVKVGAFVTICSRR